MRGLLLLAAAWMAGGCTGCYGIGLVGEPDAVADTTMSDARELPDTMTETVDTVVDPSTEIGDPMVEMLEDTHSDPGHDCEAEWLILPCSHDCSEPGVWAEACAIPPYGGPEGMIAWGAIPPKLHMLGVHDSRGDHTVDYHPMGEIRVLIDCTVVPIILSLSSREPETWIIERAPGAEIERIYVSGVYEQVVTGVPDVPVENVGSDWCYTWASPSTTECRALIEEIEARSGYTVRSFHGCYRATEFYFTQTCF